MFQVKAHQQPKSSSMSCISTAQLSSHVVHSDTSPLKSHVVLRRGSTNKISSAHSADKSVQTAGDSWQHVRAKSTLSRFSLKKYATSLSNVRLKNESHDARLSKVTPREAVVYRYRASMSPHVGDKWILPSISQHISRAYGIHGQAKHIFGASFK